MQESGKNRFGVQRGLSSQGGSTQEAVLMKSKGSGASFTLDDQNRRGSERIGSFGFEMAFGIGPMDEGCIKRFALDAKVRTGAGTRSGFASRIIGRRQLGKIYWKRRRAPPKTTIVGYKIATITTRKDATTAAITNSMTIAAAATITTKKSGTKKAELTK